MKKIGILGKILLGVTLFVLICGVATVNKATEPGDVNEIFNIRTESGGQTTTQAPTTPAPQNVPTNTNTNTNTNTTLPKLGANDTAMWVLIVACAGAAIYTYKKVRDYDV